MAKRLLIYAVAACVAFATVGLPQVSRADDHKEYLVKAAFIYNFVKFVEWPGAKAISQQPRIDICVLGESQMINAKEVFKAASTEKQTLSLVQENNPKNIAAHCHIVFISQSESGRLAEVLTTLKGQPVLTVSDINNFAEDGGMIGFVANDNKVKVEVNTHSVTTAGLRVDAQLLEIAVRVIDR